MTVLESEYPLQGYQIQFCSKFYFLIQMEVGIIFHQPYEHGMFNNYSSSPNGLLSQRL